MAAQLFTPPLFHSDAFALSLRGGVLRENGIFLLINREEPSPFPGRAAATALRSLPENESKGGLQKRRNLFRGESFDEIGQSPASRFSEFPSQFTDDRFARRSLRLGSGDFQTFDRPNNLEMPVEVSARPDKEYRYDNRSEDLGDVLHHFFRASIRSLAGYVLLIVP